MKTLFSFQEKVLPQPSILVIFGGTGDLACRKLYPALYNLHRLGQLPSEIAVVGIGRREESQEEFRHLVEKCVLNHSRKTAEPLEIEFLKLFSYQSLDLTEQPSFEKLRLYLDQLDRDSQRQRIFYMAVPPEVFSPTVKNLHGAGMSNNSRVVLEKPFGWDVLSAQALQADLTSVFAEEAIFRIDHYLGKEMLQNIMMIRLANSVFEPLWNGKYVDHIQIQVNESVGIGHRGRYYERAGALRDMVQNHLMQLLAFTAMEPPLGLGADALRDEKVRVIKALRPLTAETILTQVIRGQYGPGTIDGSAVKGYRQEEWVNPTSNMETFVAMKAYIDNDRWRDVPFYLRTGKRLPQRFAQVVVQFKPNETISGFPAFQELEPNVLIIKIQPEEGVAFQFNVKEAGADLTINPATMFFCQNCDYPENSPEAYERLLHDVLVGDAALFTRWDEVEATWEYVQPILDLWKKERKEIPSYAAGTWGPVESQKLLRREGKVWWICREDSLRCFDDH
ncbi:MAG: glucose-6-phosphate dehydrogenase [Limnochordia bacterium]|nr:glucose-6-phosphate dehydrogenase [Limnochordia bacterium]